MKFTPLAIEGAYLIELEAFTDNRGLFARQFCQKEFAAQGLDFTIRQSNLSKNYKKGVLRGLHYQKDPYPEIKVVTCLKGSVWDVIVDIRPESPTYLQYIGTTLTEETNSLLYIPAGVAHGFQALEDDSVLLYHLGEFFMPDYYSGLRWNDPKLAIQWPHCDERIINERDNSYALL